MGEIIINNKFYSISRGDNGGYVAELNSPALSGVPGLPNITFHDDSDIRLNERVAKIVHDTLNPTDPVVRRLMANQRRVYQQDLFNKKTK
jgi:hypothetical protein